MACPYFLPLARLAPGRWVSHPRLPLGDAYDGVCEAGAATETPDAETLRQCCNTGYARGRCARFPAGAPYDAVRFSARPDGEFLYVLERDYSPARHGPASEASGILAAQAQAFAGAWERLGRKEEPR